jgi:hypothetical protein
VVNKELSMDKNLTMLVERLERIFPKMEMYFDSELFNDEKDCSPAYTITWYDFLEKLKNNGLWIVSHHKNDT